MPFRWKRGSNPFVDNAFGVLQIGPTASQGLVAAQADNRAKALRGAGALDAPHAGVDGHAIAAAAKCLRDSASRAQEQLLVHPLTRTDPNRQKRLLKQLRDAARLDVEEEVPRLEEPLAIFWFTPALTAEDVTPPPWDALGLVAPGDPEDLALDVIFDC